jgi:arylsulfatase A-like enzyme
LVLVYALSLFAQLSCTPGSTTARDVAGKPDWKQGVRAARPNIVLILVDDLGQQDTSVPMLAACSCGGRQCTARAMQCQALGGTCRAPSGAPLGTAPWKTPNLERLAARGLRFSDAYAAAPVCTPSRTAILTGQSPARTHITYWTLERDRDTSSRHARLDPPAWQVNGAQPTGAELPQLLANAGYRTMHVGKAHFGARGTPGADPRNFGFDVNIAGHAAGAPGSFFGSDHFKDAARKQRGKVAPADAPPSVWDVPMLERWYREDDDGDDDDAADDDADENVWLDDALAREACEAITTAVAEQKPFFLNFCPYGVHTPIMEDPRFVADYPELDPTERAYATMIAAVDDALGQLVARCDTLGILDNTIFIFTSDNGGLSAHARGTAPDGARAHTHNAPFRSGKGSAYEGGLRVPFVVAGPGIPHEAAPRTAPIIGTDLYPTILSLAGASVPTGRAIDGVDLSNYWRGGPAPTDRAMLFHQPHDWGPQGPGIEPFSAVRVGDWKLIWFHDAAGESSSPATGDERTRGAARDTSRIELYNLASDIGEQHDLAADANFTAPRLMSLEALSRALTDSNAQLSIERATRNPISPPASPAQSARQSPPAAHALAHARHSKPDAREVNRTHRMWRAISRSNARAVTFPSWWNLEVRRKRISPCCSVRHGLAMKHRCAWFGALRTTNCT